MKRRFYHKVLGMIFGLSLFIITEGDRSFASDPQPVPGGKLVYAIPGNPDSLDPQATSGTLTFQHVKSAYDTLLEPDESGKLVPALAESYEFEEQDFTLTFHLRKGVKFHNGDTLTAADIKATFDRILAPESTSPHKSKFKHVKEVKVLDDLTVQFVLDAIDTPLLATLSSGWSAILPKRAIDAKHDFSTHPIGTGPFVFKEWVRDDHLSYTKFPEYWKQGQPYLDEVEFKVVVEPTTQLLGLFVGEFDIIEVVEPFNVPKLTSNPETKLFTHPTGLALVVAMNHARQPLNNLKVRQAICHAIDRQAVLDTAYTGGTVIGSYIDSSSPYYADYSEMYPYDPQKAKQLLTEAGYANGFEVNLRLPQNYSQHVNAGNMVQNMLQQIGITAKIQLVDWATWLSQVYRGKDFDLTIIGHTGKLDPDGRLAGFGDPNQNYINYNNPEVFHLINEAAVTPDFEKRKALYVEVQRLMAEDAMMVFIGTPLGLQGMRSNVAGFRMTYALDTPDFRETFKVK
jgi:peptide/nickel transport system substrate-binding protein